VGEEYVEGLNLLDEWWASRQTGYDIAKLHAAADIFRRLAPERPEYLAHLSEAADILLMLAEAGMDNGWQVTDELVQAVQIRMEQSATFTSFTHELLWAQSRAAVFLRPRLQWWMEAIKPTRAAE